MAERELFKAGKRASAGALNEVAGAAFRADGLRAGDGITVTRTSSGTTVSAAKARGARWGWMRATVVSRTGVGADGLGLGSEVGYVVKIIGRPDWDEVGVPPNRVWRVLGEMGQAGGGGGLSLSPAKLIAFEVGQDVPVLVTPGEFEPGGGQRRVVEIVRPEPYDSFDCSSGGAGGGGV